MRTSRIAQDTARLVESLAASPPKSRNHTRSALASASRSSAPADAIVRRASTRRNGVGTNSGPILGAPPMPNQSGLATTPDIEDAPSAPGSASGRKRKRATTTGHGKDAAPVRRSQRSATTGVKDESEEPIATEELLELDEASSFRNSGTLPPRPKVKPAHEGTDSTGKVTIHPPTLWTQQWEACERMRSRRLAPVDTMGCDRLFDPASSPEDQRFQTLVALMLSPQTKDGVTAGAMARLRSTLASRGGFNLPNIIAMDPVELDALINPVGFHNTKTRNIQAAARLLVERHAGEVPQTAAELIALPGVGPKIAYLCLQAAWNITLGIGVDVHVHRITNRWGWHRTNTPEATRAALEQWLPKEKWGPVNHMLVGFGQTICKPIGPDCENCELAELGVCPAAIRPRGGKKKSVMVGVKERIEAKGKWIEKVETTDGAETVKQEGPKSKVARRVEVKTET